ncbi:MAG TPA: hypothetical protein VFU57_05900 [Candidatus Acidoferrales bacterium]|nr:hypothetical protein [Candidatus Acidoferrales bacterium]
MFAALICVISLAMMAQFAIFFWRANMLAIAAESVSNNLIAAQSSFAATTASEEFETLATISRICPAIGPDSLKLWPARAYYRAMHLISRCSAIPQGSSWARQEMAFCARYAAVSMDRRLSSNQAYVAAIRSC